MSLTTGMLAFAHAYCYYYVLLLRGLQADELMNPACQMAAACAIAW
jgi:hypothetical protein